MEVVNVLYNKKSLKQKQSQEHEQNNQQEELKNEILHEIVSGTNRLWGIKGVTGTGKTVLLQDIAKELSQYGTCCLICSDMMYTNRRIFVDDTRKVSIMDAKTARKTDLGGYDYILTDDAQKLDALLLLRILTLYLNQKKACVFSYDVLETFSNQDKMTSKLERIQELQIRELTFVV